MHYRYLAWLSCFAGVICFRSSPLEKAHRSSNQLVGRVPKLGIGLPRPIYLMFLSNYPLGFNWLPNEVTPHLIVGPTIPGSPNSLNIDFEPYGSRPHNVPVLFRPQFWERNQPLPPAFDRPGASGQEVRRGSTDSTVFFKLGLTTLSNEQILRLMLRELISHPVLSSSHTVSMAMQSILAGLMSLRLHTYNAIQETLMQRYFRNADLYQDAVGQRSQRLLYLNHQKGDSDPMTRKLYVLVDPQDIWTCADPEAYAEAINLLDAAIESIE